MRSAGPGSRSIDAHNHLGPPSGARGRRAVDLHRGPRRGGRRALVDLDGGQGDGALAPVERWRRPDPDRLVVFAGLDYARGRPTPRSGRPRRGACATRSAAGHAGSRSGRPSGCGRGPGREPRPDRRRATRSALGDGRRARPPGCHPHRRPDRVLPTARSHERTLRGADRAPRLALLADAAARPTRCPRVPAVRRAAGGVRAARRAASRDDVRGRPRRLRGRGPRARVADARGPPEPVRRHRRAAGRAGASAVHRPRVLRPPRRPDPVRDRRARRPGGLPAPLPLPGDAGRVVRLLDRAVPGQGRWQVHGLALPDDVLRAVYRDNAVRVLRLDRATRADPPA